MVRAIRAVRVIRVIQVTRAIRAIRAIKPVTTIKTITTIPTTPATPATWVTPPTCIELPCCSHEEVRFLDTIGNEVFLPECQSATASGRKPRPYGTLLACSNLQQRAAFFTLITLSMPFTPQARRTPRCSLRQCLLPWWELAIHLRHQ